MTTGVVVGGVFLAGDQLLWVEELTVGAGSDFVDDSWFEVNKDAPWDVLASTSLGEEGVERVVAAANGLVGRHLAVRGNAVLEAVKLPASVTDLGAGLVLGRGGGEREKKRYFFGLPRRRGHVGSAVEWQTLNVYTFRRGGDGIGRYRTCKAIRDGAR